MEKYNNYTLTWTSTDNQLMECTVQATCKEHALSKALSDSIYNIFLFDYLSQFKMEALEKQTTYFMWKINGRIG
jgi:hypothetical protein